MAISAGFKYLPQRRDTSTQSRLAEALLSATPIGGPVAHPLEGAGRLANTLVSILLQQKGQRVEGEQRKADIEQMFELMQREREFEATPTSPEQELSDALLGIPGQEGVPLPSGQPDLPGQPGLIEGVVEDLPPGTEPFLRARARNDPQAVYDYVIESLSEKPELGKVYDREKNIYTYGPKVAGTVAAPGPKPEAPPSMKLITLRYPDDSVKTFDAREDKAIKQALAEGATEFGDEDQPARLQEIEWAIANLNMTPRAAANWSKQATLLTDQQLRDELYITGLKANFGDAGEAQRIAEEGMAFLRPKPEEPIEFEAIETPVPMVSERGAEAASSGVAEVSIPVPTEPGQVTAQPPPGLPVDIQARADRGDTFTEEELVAMYRDQPEAFKALKAYLELIRSR